MYHIFSMADGALEIDIEGGESSAEGGRPYGQQFETYTLALRWLIANDPEHPHHPIPTMTQSHFSDLRHKRHADIKEQCPMAYFVRGGKTVLIPVYVEG